jgi:hypothetical protein
MRLLRLTTRLRFAAAAAVLPAIAALTVTGTSRCTFAQSPAPATQPIGQKQDEGLDMAAVLEQMDQEEQRLWNLHVEAQLDVLGWDEQTQQWQATPEHAHVRAYYDGQAGGRARLDMIDGVLPWIGDLGVLGGYVRQTYATAFDGRSGRTVHYTRGPKDAVIPVQDAEVSSQRPALLRGSNWATGAFFSVQLFRDEQGMSLSEYVRDLAAKGMTVDAHAEELDGVDALHIRAADTAQQHDWWLDPARGFSIIRYTWWPLLSKDLGPDDYEFRVLRLELTGHVWYPAEANLTMRNAAIAPGIPTARRYHYTALTIRANSEDFDESIFTLVIPEGYSVHDLESGRSFRAGPATKASKADSE